MSYIASVVCAVSIGYRKLVFSVPPVYTLTGTILMRAKITDRFIKEGVLKSPVVA